MLFTFPCSCGKLILVDEGGPRQFFCPDCGRIHEMPERAIPANRPGADGSPAPGPSSPMAMANLADAPPVLPESIGLAPVEERPAPVAAVEVGDRTPYALTDMATPAGNRGPTGRTRAAEQDFHASAPPEARRPSGAAETGILPAALVVPTAEMLTPAQSAPPAALPVAALPVARPLPEAKPVTANHARPPAVTRDDMPATLSAEEQSAAQDEESRPLKREGKRFAWERLILGLGLYYAQFLSNLITLAILMLGINLMAIIEERAQPRLAAVLAIVTSLGFFLVGPVLGIVGSVLCINVPEKVGNKQFMVAALVLSAAPILFGLVFGTIFACSGVPLGVIMMGNLGLWAMYAAWICFMLFLKQVASYLEMTLCVDEASNFILISIPLMIAPTCIAVISAILHDTFMGPIITMFLFTVWLIFNSKFTLGILHLVSSIRQAIRTRERV